MPIYLILSLTFVKEVNAALDSGNHATQLFVQNFSVSGQNANNTGSGGSFYGSWQVTFEDKATASAPANPGLSS